jgi:hypothetical protein
VRHLVGVGRCQVVWRRVLDIGDRRGTECAVVVIPRRGGPLVLAPDKLDPDQVRLLAQSFLSRPPPVDAFIPCHITQYRVRGQKG